MKIWKQLFSKKRSLVLECPHCKGPVRVIPEEDALTFICPFTNCRKEFTVASQNLSPAASTPMPRTSPHAKSKGKEAVNTTRTISSVLNQKNSWGTDAASLPADPAFWRYCQNCGSDNGKLYKIFGHGLSFCSDSCKDDFGRSLSQSSTIRMFCPFCRQSQDALRGVHPRLCISCHRNTEALHNNNMASSKAKQVMNEDRTPQVTNRQTQAYFESDVPSGNGLCSDNSCPCPEVVILRGTGYLYIAQELVGFRRRYPRLQDARRAKELQLTQRRASLGIQFSAFYRLGPILVCEQGAKLRKLDLEAARADAKHWWATGQVPLRVTPLA